MLLVLGVVAYWDTVGDTRVFGFYAKKVIPYGAGCAGLIAGLGFSVSLKALGRPVTGRFLLGIFAIGVAGFFLFHLWGYHQLNNHHDAGIRGNLAFTDYVQELARSLTIKRDYNAAGHEALGKWGYLCLGAELLCFAGGFVVFCIDLQGAPHCQECVRYLDLVGKHFHSTASQVAVVKKLPKADQLFEIQSCKDELDDLARRYEQLLERNPPNDLRKLIQHFSSSESAKALGWLEFSAYCCPACAAQTLQINRYLLNVASKIDNLHHTMRALSNVSISSPQSRYRQQVTFSLPT